MKKNKKLLLIVAVALIVGVSKHVYDMHINHNFETISAGKVYKSGVIPPDQLESYLTKYGIKSVIDLRFPDTGDDWNNPEIPAELIAEREAIAKIKGVTYFNNGSRQVPSQKNLDLFFSIMDNKENYPVLIHCHHGVGRAEMYSALYKIEYENMNADRARTSVRLLTKWSAFDVGTPKGDYLRHYKKREEWNNSPLFKTPIVSHENTATNN